VPKEDFIFIVFLFPFFFYCYYGIYRGSYYASNISHLNSLLHILLYPPPTREIVSQGSFFILHSCVHNVCTIFTFLHPFPTSFPPHCIKPLPRQDLFCPPVLWFCQREKKWHFCLFKITAQGVSLWHFHMYIYYSPIWFNSSIFLHSTLVPFLCWFQFKIFHSCIESASTIFTFLTSFFYPPPLVCDLPLVWPVFHKIATFGLGLYSTYEISLLSWTTSEQLCRDYYTYSAH
jgi:hypothetical protein